MKPSQFRRIEKKAFEQKNEFKTGMMKAEKLKMNLAYQESASNLKNLINTMKDLRRH